MPNNPIQLVVNGEDFIQAPEPGRKGPEKDFFENRDVEFAAHKAALIAALDAIDQAISHAGHGPATYVRVVLREAALAKSYRPNSALLTSDRFPCVGAGAIGELFFFLPQIQIAELKERIGRAENTVRIAISARSGQSYPTTTRLRSEVGAIESIEIVPVAGKRLFSAAAAVRSLLNPHSFPGYQVELFEVPALHEIATDRSGRRELFDSLFRLLLALGPGARSYLLPAVGRTPMLEVQLTRSPDAPALVDLSQLAVTSAETPTVPEVDPDVARHEAALTRVAAHPLVRQIDPPVQLSLDEESSRPLPKPFPVPVRAA
jgi:hypothetical protein